MIDRPSLPPHEPPPDRRPIRERVSADVLAYLDYLRAEMGAIAERYGTTDLRELRRKVGTGEVSLDDGSRLAKLVEAFERAARENEVPEAAVEMFRQEFMESLGKVAGNPVFAKILEMGPGELEIATRVFETETCAAEIQGALDELPFLPAEILLRSDSFMAEILAKLRVPGVEGWKDHSGLIASLVMRHVMRNMPAEVLERVVQVIDAESLGYLGYGWSGGKLVVRGTSGDYLGMCMTGGRIEAEEVMSSPGFRMTGGIVEISGTEPVYIAGEEMEGGEIHLKTAKGILGFRMRGGKIFACDALAAVGSEMQDGTISISGEVSGSVGEKMQGGVILADKVTGSNEIGQAMNGTGRIRVRQADDATVGREMRRGRVEIGGSCARACYRMVGGSVVIDGRCEIVGHDMEGGDVEIGQGGSVGNNMYGGNITVRGDAEIVGDLMWDGTVTVHGTAKVGAKKGGTVTVLGNVNP